MSDRKHHREKDGAVSGLLLTLSLARVTPLSGGYVDAYMDMQEREHAATPFWCVLKHVSVFVNAVLTVSFVITLASVLAAARELLVWYTSNGAEVSAVLNNAVFWGITAGSVLSSVWALNKYVLEKIEIRGPARWHSRCIALNGSFPAAVQRSIDAIKAVDPTVRFTIHELRQEAKVIDPVLYAHVCGESYPIHIWDREHVIA